MTEWRAGSVSRSRKVFETRDDFGENFADVRIGHREVRAQRHHTGSRFACFERGDAVRSAGFDFENASFRDTDPNRILPDGPRLALHATSRRVRRGGGVGGAAT